MLKDIVTIHNSLKADNKKELMMAFFNYISSNEDDKITTYKELFDLLLDCIYQSSTVNILTLENKSYTTELIHLNLSRYRHLLLALEASNIDNLIVVNLNFFTGNLGIVVDLRNLTVQIEFPDWLTFLETPDAIYFVNGVIPSDSSLYKTFKFKQRFIGLRCK
jgi:hypothetical protein